MRKTIIKLTLTAILSGLFSILSAQGDLPGIYINEFMASNSSTVLSRDFNEYSDWIEIHNAEDTTVNIGGYYLTDDLADPQKWQIPADTRIYQGRRTLFWADGQNVGQHTNFKLSASGEEIGLFTPDGVLIDSISFSKQFPDVSFGRYPNGGDTLFYFDPSTPGTSNLDPGFAGVVSDPTFSDSGGFYQGSLSIEIAKSDPNDIVRYTLDGSPPDMGSSIYSSAIPINSTTVIRARSFRENYIPSDILTQSYFIDETTTLPVVSIVTDPDNLWDDKIGIYVEGTNGVSGYCVSEPRNWNQPWERPISLEMFEAGGDHGFKIDAGMQIGGGCTRKYPQKTLAIYTRSKYGDSKIKYPIFEDKAIQEYNNINIRNSGQDWWRGMFRDGLMHTIVKNNMDIDWQAYKPAILFLNGEYWGIHGIREKHNEHYLESNYGIDPDAIDILSGGGSIKQGSANHYGNMTDYIQTHDLAIDEHYDWVETQMDINEYLNYMISEIYFANIDWPGGNIKFWRQQGEGHKWRWILFDTDLGFGAHDMGQYYSNTLENATSPEKTYYANPTWSTFLLRSLLENEGFRDQFIQRFASHLNVSFEPTRVLGIIDSLRSMLEPEIPRHIRKWSQSTSFNDGWAYHVNVMKEFALLRPQYVMGHLIEKFDLTDTTRLHVNNNDITMGNIFINGVKLPEQVFEGTFFTDVPLQCAAVANPGYEFIGWRGDIQSANETIELELNSESSLEAIFRFDRSIEYHGLRINEILASNVQNISDENGEFDDWIELYNHSLNAVDIGGMYLTDNFQEPTLWQIPDTDPSQTTIQPGGYLLLWADKDTDQGILHLDLKLSSNGEGIGIGRQSDSGFVVIDTLSFCTQTADISYGRLPNGGDDLIYFNVPSPGNANISTGTSEEDIALPTSTLLSQNYPNPFNPTTAISYQLSTDSKVKLSVYDMNGKKVKTLVNGFRSAGYHEVKWDASGHSSGIYISRLDTRNETHSRKMILIK